MPWQFLWNRFSHYIARTYLFALLLLSAGLAAGHPNFSLAQIGTNAAQQEQLQIINFAFDPETITVPAGTELVWTNEDGAPHTVTASDSSFDSGTLAQDESYSLTLTELGITNYICTIHPSMRGSIEVTAADDSGDDNSGDDDSGDDSSGQQLYLPLVENPGQAASLPTADPTSNPTATPGANDQTATIPPGTTATATITPTPTATSSPTAMPAETPAGLQRWSDPATWGGAVPAAGDTVTIAAGQSVLLDVSPPALKSLMINGELHFDAVDLNLTAGWIVVRGKLQAGTAMEPYTNRAIITLTGTGEANTDIMGMGDKVLGVMETGQLRLHGETRTSWVRLNATANKGDTALTLDQEPNWRAGDQIVVASTDFDHEQAETFTIAQINGTQVSLDQPLAYLHWGQLQTYSGHTVDERAEVGLLSRNILIQGTADAENDGIGGHIMAMMDADIYLDGIELYRMGQRAGLGRYPVHFHLQGDGSRGSVVKNSSIHHTFNRCLTIHGSNGVLVESVVAYDAPGHCYFLEDAAEFDNTLIGNLGLGIYRPESENALLRSDTEFKGPAVFWITNPQNTIRDNVAAGSEGSGFWVALPQHPTGPSFTEEIWPVRLPVQEFAGNVAHSNGSNGLHVDDGPTGSEDGDTSSTFYAAYSDPTNTDSAVIPVTFANMTVYKNRNNGVWLRGREHILDGAIVADNSRGVTFASEDTVARNSLFVGETANVGQPEPWMINEGGVGENGRSLPFPWNPDFPIRGFEFYDGTVGVVNSHFEGFAANSIREAGALSHLDFTAFAVSPLNYATGLTFANDTKRIYMATRATPDDPGQGSEDGYRSAVFLDTDGSVTGAANQYVVVDNPLLLNDSCSKQDNWNVWLCPQASYVGLAIILDSPELNSVSLSRAGQTHTLFGAGYAPGTYFRSSILNAEEHTLTFDDHIPTKFRTVLRFGGNKPLQLRIPNYTQYPKVTQYGRELAPASNLTELTQASASSFFYSTDDSTLYLRMVTDEPYLALVVEENGTPAPITGSGTGLSGTYYPSTDFTGTPVSRLDGTINFRWEDAPFDGFPADEFTIRWAGQVEAPEAGDYTFEIRADDSVRLWVCGEQLVEHWQDGYDPNPRFGAVTFTAGQRCDIQIDYREYTQAGFVDLWWQFGEYARQIVPQRQLYPE